MPYLALVGAAVEAGGAMYAGYGGYKAAQYSSEVAKINATQAGYQAAEAETQGRVQQDTIRQIASANIAMATTAEAASGIQVGAAGTSEEVLSGIAEQGAVGVAKSEYNTALTAWGYKTQQTAFENQAILDTSQGTKALVAGSIAATGSLLQGAIQYNTQVMGVVNKIGQAAGGGGAGSAGNTPQAGGIVGFGAAAINSLNWPVSPGAW